MVSFVKFRFENKVVTSFAFLLILTYCCSAFNQNSQPSINNYNNDNLRSFFIDYERNTFVKDGKDFRYISGSFHYFRSVSEYWDDVMKKFRLAGLNALQTYVEWSSHQPTPTENYNFEGNLNLFKFLDTAMRNDLLVILRPGPFICAERDFGGLPAWLLWQKLNMTLRSTDLEYVYFVSRWFDHLLPKLKPYLYSNGGPIIMIQIENEYGSYSCDNQYPIFLRDLFRLHLGDDVILFTTDGNVEADMKCGNIPDVYATIDFGPLDSSISVNKSFNIQRMFAPRGPLINSEYYPGWLDHWSKPHSTARSSKVASTLSSMLAMGANVNIYMFYGGTSFGYGSGANIDGTSFDPCPTSYDYDAPLSEARDPTIKYFDLKDTIANFVKVPAEDPVFSPKAKYGHVLLKKFAHLLNMDFLELFAPKPVVAMRPLSFEELKISSGFVLYSTIINIMTTDPVLFSAPELKDRAYMYVDNKYVGVLGRSEGIFKIALQIRPGQTLSALVENQGRPNYGKIGEQKGLGKTVQLGNKQLKQIWTMCRIGELNGKKLTKYATTNINSIDNLNESDGVGLHVGSLIINRNETNTTTGYPLDTFVRLDEWSKGMIWVNGFNLGRYWPAVGPQETLYLPGPLLKFSPEINKIIVLELEHSPSGCCGAFIKHSHPLNCTILLTDVHVIDGPTPYQASSRTQMMFRHG